jgi:catechol 1,2-dioxygenase
MNDTPLTRRCFIGSALGATAVLTGVTRLARADGLPPTPSNPLGPYYRPGAPFRNQLFDDNEPGTWLLVSGQVLGTDGKPLPRTLLDVWQCDADGEYDNDSSEYRGRGRLFADKQGYYSFLTIWPGHYLVGDTYRPAHIHVQLSTRQVYWGLTTQLYFKDDPYNAGDPSYLPELELDPHEINGLFHATFRFILGKKP